MNELEIDNIRMLDNLHNGNEGTNGIIAMNAKLDLYKIEVI